MWESDHLPFKWRPNSWIFEQGPVCENLAPDCENRKAANGRVRNRLILDRVQLPAITDRCRYQMESGGIYQLHQIWQHLAVPIWLIWQSLRIRHPLIFAPTKGAILRYIFRSRRFRQQQAAMRKQIDVTSWSPVVAQLHCWSLWQAAQQHQQPPRFAQQTPLQQQ